MNLVARTNDEVPVIGRCVLTICLLHRRVNLAQ